LSGEGGQRAACSESVLRTHAPNRCLKSVNDALEERATSETSAKLAALQVKQVGVQKPNRRAPRPNQSQRRGKKKKEAREQTDAWGCELRYGAERSEGGRRQTRTELRRGAV